MTGADTLSLAGRTAIVTGAARGIGRAIALMFAEHGADLALCDREADDLDQVAADVRSGGRACLTQALDVRDEAGTSSFLGSVGAEFGEVHVLVNNAGGTFQAAFAEASAKGDETLVRENLLSAALVTRGALALLGGDACIINVTSIEGSRAAPGFAVYAAAKAGLESLTRTLALELAPIRVNAIAPDVIVTPGVGDLSAVTTPLGRVGRADEVASVALFLASDLASFVTGAVIPVDGGNLAAGGWRQGADGQWVT